MVKLNKRKIKWLIDQVLKYNKRPSEVAVVYNISVRRVQQLVKAFKDTKKYPELKKNRRPKTFLSDKDKEIIKEFYMIKQSTPFILYYELRKAGYKIAKNKLYSYMKSQGWVKNEPKKQKRRKRVRYERKHSGSLIHGDFHRTSENHPYCILWLDDASRKIIAGTEIDKATDDVAISTLKEVIRTFEKYEIRIREVNTDRGTQFYNSKKDKRGNRTKSKFEKFLESEGITHIVSRVNNPQTNGKLERRWLEYDRHRWRFNSLQEWIDWYNDRLTTALDIEAYETPNIAFYKKLPNIFALFWRWAENEEGAKKY